MNTRKYLLTADDINQMEAKKITHFLNPNAVRLNKSLGDAVGMSEMGVHIIYVDPGRDSTEFHKHLYEEESIYIISGTGKLTIESDEYAVATGDFVGLPANQVAHQLTNNGSETLICLVMGQRLTHDIGDYPNKNKRIYRHAGNADVVEYENIEYPTINTGKSKA